MQIFSFDNTVLVAKQNSLVFSRKVIFACILVFNLLPCILGSAKYFFWNYYCSRWKCWWWWKCECSNKAYENERSWGEMYFCAYKVNFRQDQHFLFYFAKPKRFCCYSNEMLKIFAVHEIEVYFIFIKNKILLLVW